MGRRSSRRYPGANSCSRLGRNEVSGAWGGTVLLHDIVRGRHPDRQDNPRAAKEPPSIRELPASKGCRAPCAAWRLPAEVDKQNTDIRLGQTGSAAYLCGYGTAWRQRTSREFPRILFESGRRRPLNNLETRGRLR